MRFTRGFSVSSDPFTGRERYKQTFYQPIERDVKEEENLTLHQSHLLFVRINHVSRSRSFLLPKVEMCCCCLLSLLFVP